MSWFFPLAVTLLLIWLGVPLVPVAIGLAAFTWWFLRDRPAHYGRPPQDLPWNAKAGRPPAEHPPER